MSWILKLPTLLLVGAAAGCTVWTLWHPVACWWDRYLTQWSRWLQLELEAMHRKVSLDRCRQLLSASVILMFLLGFLVNYSLLVGVLTGAAGFWVPRSVIGYLRRRRFKQFNDQLVDALTLISNALRSGLSLPQALELVVKETKPPISEEFSVVLKETRLGLLLDEALQNLSRRVPVDDLNMVVTSILTIRETGGKLTEAFDTFSKTVTERKKVEGKIKAMTAQGMMQGVMMCAIPPVLAIAFYLLDPTLMEPMFTTILGIMMLLVMVGLEAMGIWMMLNIVRIDV